MAKFKKLLKEATKEKLNEAVGGVVSTPAINAGSGVANGRSASVRSGDSRVDTGGEFTYRAGELPGFDGSPDTSSDWEDQANPKQAFSEGGGSNTVVLHEDDGGSVTLREHGQGSYDVVVRAGSDEKVFELDEDAVKKVSEIFS